MLVKCHREIIPVKEQMHMNQKVKDNGNKANVKEQGSGSHKKNEILKQAFF